MDLVSTAAPAGVANVPAQQDGLCRYLDWDSAFFGYRLGRINVHRLDEDIVAKVLQWQRQHDIDGLYFLTEFDDPATIRLAEAAGFRLVDLRITLRLSFADGVLHESERVPNLELRPADGSDLSALQSLAALSFTDSRFYFDSMFARERCNALYVRWLERSMTSAHEVVFVAESADGVVGFVSCVTPDPSTGQIGLIAVAREAAGRGAGRALVRGAIHHFRGIGVSAAEVVTQGRNIGAQRLYQRCGFVTQSIQLWYHYWPRSEREGNR